jgi:hypothetical protein
MRWCSGGTADTGQGVWKAICGESRVEKLRLHPAREAANPNNAFNLLGIEVLHDFYRRVY